MAKHRKIILYISIAIAIIFSIPSVSHGAPSQALDGNESFDPLGIKNLFNIGDWKQSIKETILPTKSIGGAILDIFSFNMRDFAMDSIFNPLSRKLFYTSTRIIDSAGFSNLYKFFTRMAESYIVLIFLWNAFKLILGRESAPLSILFIKVVLGFAYLGLIPYAIKGIIWLNNQLCDSILSFVGGKGVFSPMLHPTFSIPTLLIFTIIYFVFCIRLLFYYYGRDYMITLLILIAPFMWFFWLDDNLKQNTSMWVRNLIIIIFTQFVHSMQLAIFSVIVIGLGGSSETFWGNIDNIIFSIISMAYMVKTPAFIKQFTYEASTGNVSAAAKEIGRYITFAKERKLLRSLTKGGK